MLSHNSETSILPMERGEGCMQKEGGARSTGLLYLTWCKIGEIIHM